MPDPEKIDKRLEEELGKILDERGRNLPQPQSRGRRPPPGGGLFRAHLTWRGLLRRVALAVAAIVLLLLVVRLGPIVALRLVPFLLMLGISVFVLSQVSRLYRR